MVLTDGLEGGFFGGMGGRVVTGKRVHGIRLDWDSGLLEDDGLDSWDVTPSALTRVEGFSMHLSSHRLQATTQTPLSRTQDQIAQRYRL